MALTGARGSGKSRLLDQILTLCRARRIEEAGFTLRAHNSGGRLRELVRQRTVADVA